MCSCPMERDVGGCMDRVQGFMPVCQFSSERKDVLKKERPFSRARLVAWGQITNASVRET